MYCWIIFTVDHLGMYFYYVILLLQKDEVYLNLVLEYVPETVYRVARNCSKSKQTLPPLLIKVIV